MALVDVDQTARLPLGAGNIAFDEPPGDPGTLRLLVPSRAEATVTWMLDTGLDEHRRPRNQPLAHVTVGQNPNLLAVHRPPDGSALALVSCFGASEVVAVELATFSLVAHIDVGEGPNEMAIDERRHWLLVANTLDSTTSVIDLRPTSGQYLREFAVLGARRDSR
ncbi:MAG: hypothetical protein B7733_16875 [Myxococcales bacterium FL481]|nr:MAG: hypothetical protein B7733_16875 [Myxococcales bacterium FL481]